MRGRGPRPGPCRTYEHRHSGIGYHTPYDVHHGEAELVRDLRAKVLADAYSQHPERFVRKFPERPAIPDQAWINRPTDNTVAEQSVQRPQEIR